MRWRNTWRYRNYDDDIENNLVMVDDSVAILNDIDDAMIDDVNNCFH